MKKKHFEKYWSQSEFVSPISIGSGKHEDSRAPYLA